jgi:hypothetical protein
MEVIISLVLIFIMLIRLPDGVFPNGCNERRPMLHAMKTAQVLRGKTLVSSGGFLAQEREQRLKSKPENDFQRKHSPPTGG